MGLFLSQQILVSVDSQPLCPCPPPLLYLSSPADQPVTTIPPGLSGCSHEKQDEGKENLAPSWSLSLVEERGCQAGVIGS